VPANASLEEIKLAYRRRIAEYHPDKTSGLGDELRALAEEKSKIINAAYDEAMHAVGK
jgi:DnaJ-class molecular chaperone with C-terminal Zn finger domain